MSGTRKRFTPMPTMTELPVRSSSIPASLALSTKRSLGHLSANPERPGAMALTASKTVTPATSESVCAPGSPPRSRTSVDPMKFPAPSLHTRPWRPRPATCRSATSHAPSATCSPLCTRLTRSALVDPVAAMTSIKTASQNTCQAIRNSAEAAVLASPSSHLVSRYPKGDMITAARTSRTLCAHSLRPVTTSRGSSKYMILTTLM